MLLAIKQYTDVSHKEGDNNYILFFILYMFDLVFGNMSEPENLPLMIGYKGLLTKDNSTVYLSKIISINRQR